MSKELMPIRRARKQEEILYDVSQDELDKLEKGAFGSPLISLSLFFFSAGISFIIALLTANPDDRTYFWFGIVIGVSFLFGLFLGVLWFLNRRSVMSTIDKIRSRLIPDGDPVPIDEE